VKRSLATLLVVALICAAGVLLVLQWRSDSSSPLAPSKAPASADDQTAATLESEPIARSHLPAADLPRGISSKPAPILGPKAVLSVRVLNAHAGEAVVGLSVSVFRPAGPGEAPHWYRELGEGSWTALTDEYFPPQSDSTGRVRVDVPANVELRACVSSPGAEYRANPLVEVGLLEGEEREVDMHVRRAVDHVLRGRVIDDAGSAPLEGVEVSLVEYSQSIQGATTDAAGHFAIPLRSWRTEALKFEKDEYVSRTCKVEVGEIDGDSEVRMQRAARLVGHLLDERGEFLTMSSIRLIGEDGYESSCFCDEKGGFEIAGIPPGLPLEVTIERWSRQILYADPLPALQPGETRTLELRTSQPRRLEGLVVDENRKPVPGIALILAPDRPDAACVDQGWFRSELPKSTTNADGHFAFEEVYAGSWMLGTADLLPSRATPIVVGTGDLTPVVVEILNNARIGGVVLDPQGKPASAAMLTIGLEGCPEWAPIRSGPNGEFSVPVRGRWTYRVCALGMPGMLPSKVVEASAGSMDLRLQLEPAAMLLLELAEPISAGDGADVICLSSDAQQFVGVFGDDGRAEVSLPTGSYRVLVQCGDGRYSRIENASVEVGQRKPARKIALQPKASMRVVARDFASAIELEWSCEEFSLGLTVLEPSSEIALDVPAGTVSVRYQVRGGSSEWKRVAVSVEPGELFEVVLRP